MRNIFASIILLLAVSAAPAFAETAAESVVRQLGDYGYRSIVTRRTLLGRIRITAERNGATREIVLNRWTGAILMDRYLDDEVDGGVLGDAPGGLLRGTGGENVEEDSSPGEDHLDSLDSEDGGEEDEVDEEDEKDDEEDEEDEEDEHSG